MNEIADKEMFGTVVSLMDQQEIETSCPFENLCRCEFHCSCDSFCSCDTDSE